LSVWILITIWGLSFCFCVLVLVVERVNIPDLFQEAIKTMFDTFATPLGAILGFVFSPQTDKTKTSKSTGIAMQRRIDIVAIAVSLFYCGIFDYFVFLFALHQMNVTSVIDAFAQIRPYLAFLITGMIAFYFGSSKKTEP
jgi:hypothetical protein